MGAPNRGGVGSDRRFSTNSLLHLNKNSSGDEIANVKFFMKISHTYLKIPKKITYCV